MSGRPKATPKKPKAAKEAEKEARQVPTPVLVRNLSRAAAFLIIAGIASPISQLNLSPVYGSIPASLKHQRAMELTAVATLTSRNALRKMFPTNVTSYISVIAYWTPVIQFLLFPFSSQLGIDYGPLAIELVTYFPLFLISCFAASELIDTVDLPRRFRLTNGAAQAIISVFCYFIVTSISKFVASILPGYIGTHLVFSRLGAQTFIGTVSAFLAPSSICLLGVPAIAHTLWANPHYPTEAAMQRVNTTLFENHNYTILARQESLTGYVSVLENIDDQAFRLMRCDHSLLGGEWLVTPFAASKGQRQRESIFSVFVLLEAVRLVKNPRPSVDPPIPDSQKSALVIGLGIGTAPNALISHNINTTIVELDPVVHHYATKYFSLSPNHTAVIDDAVTYVRDTSLSNPGSYDMIIHDVFTGGAEPVWLFTQEFFQGLSDLLKDDGGAVAINYAGDLALGSTRLVLNTIHSVFPACRLFRDTPRAADWKAGDSDFINMVVFCVKNDYGKGKDAVRFREAGHEDWRGSIARRNFLQPRDDLEIPYVYTKPEEGPEVMRRKDVGELEKYHKQGAVSHWKIMRSVLPDGVWETW
ncbi:hypothetical protein BU24DRAFT_423551 [Aaosphaeria arxii CBS 175.79]|uniref:S-adenosyl-L-methionine-dependent methyltransferase n=1 Tax=Aaosphaeria arxii CBS 175.79 TaxID=1450172 RepID=A0A6A5XN04_9PLEO|nr:uncharacterized protein BU24DRAFT_423551 [Aaosphaeria arxii CBS 175.79]KAF2014645.1 hypothetical protein BU24DRAFT_423551 [Aaosphaeria arxii CBS 175.79]